MWQDRTVACKPLTLLTALLCQYLSPITVVHRTSVCVSIRLCVCLGSRPENTRIGLILCMWVCSACKCMYVGYVMLIM